MWVDIVMRRKFFLWTFISVGSAVGGWLPSLWGASYFSLQSIFLGMVGSLLGIWGWYRLSQVVDL